MENKEPIYKNGCWTCKKALEWNEGFTESPRRSAKQDPAEQYTCPKLEQHWKDYEQQY